jgi:hypothetical protein
MRVLLALFLIGTFATAGSSQSGSQPGKKNILLNFVDQHISIFVLGEGDLAKFHTKGTNVGVVTDPKASFDF